MQTATKDVLNSMAWDPNLNGFRTENGKVQAVKCGLLLAEDQTAMQPGDVFYRLIAATFIDEVAAQGKHEVTGYPQTRQAIREFLKTCCS